MKTKSETGELPWHRWASESCTATAASGGRCSMGNRPFLALYCATAGHNGGSNGAAAGARRRPVAMAGLGGGRSGHGLVCGAWPARGAGPTPAAPPRPPPWSVPQWHPFISFHALIGGKQTDKGEQAAAMAGGGVHPRPQLACSRGPPRHGRQRRHAAYPVRSCFVVQASRSLLIFFLGFFFSCSELRGCTKAVMLGLCGRVSSSFTPAKHGYDGYSALFSSNL